MISLLLVAALLLCLFAGCAKRPAETEASPVPTAEDEPAPTEVPETPEPEEIDGVPVRWQDGGKLSFLPHELLTIPDLNDMVYEHPETETLIAEIDALTAKVPECDNADALLSDYYEIAVRFAHLDTMFGLAMFRFDMDIYDSDATEEYDYCDEQTTVVYEKMDALYAAFAASPCRDALEQAYFGEGFFQKYDDFNAADDAFFDLILQENDLIFRYYQRLQSVDFSSYYDIKQNHDEIGNMFIELVKVRGEIAKAKGYETYTDYCYADVYYRDYTTVQAREYLDLVKQYLAPLMENRKIIEEYDTFSRWYQSDAMMMLGSAAEKMGGPILESFRFMEGHKLYDISEASRKASMGYTTYLPDYESPFIFIDPSSKGLVTTLFHEFGHFADGYCNFGLDEGMDIAEIYSQAMQYLAFSYADPFTDEERTQNLRATLANLLYLAVLREGAYADFELQVYALAPEELTLDRLDAIYEQCMQDFGLGGFSGAQFTKIYWVAYGHFFDCPGYVISYSVSAIPALEICCMEAETPGAGVEAFCRLLGRTHGKGFAAVVEEAGLGDPFAAETMERTAAFLKNAFDMN